MVFLLNKISHAGKGSTRRQRTNRTDFFPYSLIHSTPAKYPALCWALRMDANNFSSSSSSGMGAGKNTNYVFCGLWCGRCYVTGQQRRGEKVLWGQEGL